VLGVLNKVFKPDCHGGSKKLNQASDRVVIVGSPNVGKSALFNKLTGRYVTVSNYPGTTVEVAAGRSAHFGPTVDVIDTPGMYSFVPVSEEERVAKDILFEKHPMAVLHVVDAKNIERMLGLTLQLIDAHLPVILVLNMADEAERLGIHIDKARLEQELGVPVVETVATSGKGIDEVVARIKEHNHRAKGRPLRFDEPLERTIHAIAVRLSARGAMSARTRALLIVQEDPDELAYAKRELGAEADALLAPVVAEAKSRTKLQYQLPMAVRRASDKLISQVVQYPPRQRRDLREKLSQFCMNPWTGIPLLVLVLYLGLYKFVGQFGAGDCVNFLENTVFGAYVNPWAEQLVRGWIPWQTLADLFVGEYGIITLGVRYAVALILPVVGMFFLAFSILEDSGYLPRLAMLIDRIFKRIGLNGRAVIPLVLGFGCDTMATMVTRTLETRRERVIATILLALAIPCSAQMGLILALLAQRPAAMALWIVLISVIFVAVGMLSAKLLPGRQASFYMELPPLRLPRPGNVLVKTYTRLAWYFKEILPMFILASLFIWIGQVTGLFQMVVNGMKPVVGSLGLPQEAAVSFLFGFFRRDYGAAGLYDLQRQGGLSGNQLLIAATTLTLFLPCIAQFLMMKKERGWKVTLLMSLFICIIAYGVGFGLNIALNLLKVQL
jgi:ferrous iron transport protein B